MNAFHNSERKKNYLLPTIKISLDIQESVKIQHGNQSIKGDICPGTQGFSIKSVPQLYTVIPGLEHFRII